jgi:hypothetical protein
MHGCVNMTNQEARKYVANMRDNSLVCINMTKLEIRRIKLHGCVNMTNQEVRKESCSHLLADILQDLLPCAGNQRLAARMKSGRRQEHQAAAPCTYAGEHGQESDESMEQGICISDGVMNGWKIVSVCLE